MTRPNLNLNEMETRQRYARKWTRTGLHLIRNGFWSDCAYR